MLTRILRPSEADRAQGKLRQNGNNRRRGSPDDRKKERTYHIAFALHECECFRWIREDQGNGIEEAFKNPELLPMFPWQATPRQTSIGAGRWRRKFRLACSRRSDRRNQRRWLFCDHLRKRAPVWHSLPPTKIGWIELTYAEAFSSFVN